MWRVRRGLGRCRWSRRASGWSCRTRRPPANAGMIVAAHTGSLPKQYAGQSFAVSWQKRLILGQAPRRVGRDHERAAVRRRKKELATQFVKKSPGGYSRFRGSSVTGMTPLHGYRQSFRSLLIAGARRRLRKSTARGTPLRRSLWACTWTCSTEPQHADAARKRMESASGRLLRPDPGTVLERRGGDKRRERRGRPEAEPQKSERFDDGRRQTASEAGI
jgi:hypothetical protein